MDMVLKMLNIQMILVMYMFCGYIAKKAKVITQSGQGALIDLTMNLLLPMMVVNSFLDINTETLKSASLLLAVSVAVAVIAMIGGRFIYSRFESGKRAILNYATIVSNASFAGLPVIQELFGAVGLVYAAVFCIPTRIMMWTVGLAGFTGKKKTLKDTLITLFKNPNIIAVFIGLLLGLAKIRLPEPVSRVMSGLSSCVTPMCMVIIGAIIADVSVKSFFEEAMPVYCLIRLVLMPLISLLTAKLLGCDDIACGTALILIAMPAPSTTAVLAEKYGGNGKYASKLVFLSTLLSIITVPALTYLL